MDIQYVHCTANGQAIAGECHVVGMESLADSRFSFYDEADDSQTAASLCNTLKASSYHMWAKIMFPLPGMKISNGVYVAGGFDEGTVNIWYHRGKAIKDSILWTPISEANVTISAQPCELIGGNIWSGSILIYDAASAIAANLISTMKTGSYFSYSETMFSSPIKCVNGLYIVGTGGKGEIFWRPL